MRAQRADYSGNKPGSPSMLIFGAENPDLIGDEGEENETLEMKPTCRQASLSGAGRPRVLTLGGSF